MKVALWSISAILALLWGTAAAQGQIYESTEKGGVREYSDQPTSGSKSVTLPPPNISDAPMPSEQPQPAVVSTGYEQLSIVSPADQGTLHTNTGEFNVNVNVNPALNADRGDRFMVTLDGNALPSRYTSATMSITSQDFEAAAADNVMHQLQVAVVDSSGNVLITAGPVKFYVHRATVRRRSRR